MQRRAAPGAAATLDAVVRRLLTPIVAVLVVLALLVGVFLGGHPGLLPSFARNALVSDSDGRVYEEAVDKIAADYYRKIDRKKLLNDSLTAAVASLKDRFSHYIDPSQYHAFEESTNGEFEGVGLNVEQIPAGLRVVTVFDGGPARKAGLRKGDEVVGVGGKSLKGVKSDRSTDLIKGPAGTSVRLTILRGGRRFDKTVQRDSVSVPVSQERIATRNGTKYGYVSLAQFTSGAHGAVGANVRKALKAGAKGIVLDLRDNGGGLLQEGVLVASVFLRDGTVVTTRGRARAEKTYAASGDAIAANVPVVVLVNRGTASASEIVTGALQDRARATVVGTRTFGKGVFQEIEGLTNGGALDITVGQYFTPKGRNLGPHAGKPGGITPDVRVTDDPKTARDEALDRALAVLAGK
ncbi:MAG: carboxyl-terminal processing protease [Solirubrobacteraceae bacterium]|nr:carboxyl-terminal processing protease [Solirubrobacteraceae bacterium]